MLNTWKTRKRVERVNARILERLDTVESMLERRLGERRKAGNVIDFTGRRKKQRRRPPSGEGAGETL